MVATVEISKAEQMIGESNPLTDIVADNGEISSVTYTTTDSSTVASIVVAANGQEITYNINCVFKPDFTLTDIDSNGRARNSCDSASHQFTNVVFIDFIKNLMPRFGNLLGKNATEGGGC